MQTYEICSDMIDVVLDMASIYGTAQPAASPLVAPPPSGLLSTPHPSSVLPSNTSPLKKNDNNQIKSSTSEKNEDDDSYAMIHLQSGVLYLKPVNASLVIVCLIRADSFDKRGLIDYNFRCLCESILEVLQ